MKRHALIVLAIVLFPTSAASQTIASSSSSTPFPGVRIVEGRTSGPGTDFYAAFVSLCEPNVHVGASSYNGFSTSASWGNAVGAELAVNGDFFTTSPRNHIYGDAVGGGVRWASNRSGLAYSGDWYHNKYGWLAFGDDRVEYTNSEWVKNTDRSTSGWGSGTVAPDPPSGTQALVSGFPQLVIDGEPITCSSATASSCFPDRSDMRARHPRTAMGLTEDRQTFILLVVDGRSSRSSGMYGVELAKLIHDLGAHVAFNLDGGGSSQMWVRGRGTINRPSDGSPRSVLNHWGVFAGGGNDLPSIPSSCDNRFDGLFHELHGQLQRTVDLDGDGLGDACIRTSDGLRCSTFRDGAFGAPFAGPSGAAFDDPGWSDPSHYATMRWGDINGDGLADVCGRNDERIRCWTSTGDGFSEPIDGPEFPDSANAYRTMYSTTIRLADVTGDGLDDVCMRWSNGMRCYPSTGEGFGEAFVADGLSNDAGFTDPSRFGTIRTGDVNGDGLDDVCGRTPDGFRCWPSTGTGFGAAIEGPTWSDASGWTNFRYFSTIRLVDLDGDGLDDVCARAADALHCHLSEGDGFGARITGPAFADESGWRDYSNYATLRFADVTGDGMLDVCARANAGIRCYPFDGESFGPTISTELLRDETGWHREHYHRTLDFIDLDGDGRADLCARASRGIVCWRSLGDGFEETLIEGPAWSDELGFDHPSYYSTLTFLGHVRPLPADPEPGDDAGSTPGDAGTIPGTGGDAGASNPPGGDGPSSPGSPDAGGSSGGDASPMVVGAEGGCGCATGDGRGAMDVAFGVLIVGLFASRLRRKPRPVS